MSAADRAAATAATAAAPSLHPSGGHGPSLPPYQQAAADLRRRILSGRLGPGERLPAGRSLQQQYALAGMTVRAALHTLRAEGLVDACTAKAPASPIPCPGRRCARTPPTPAASRLWRPHCAMSSATSGHKGNRIGSSTPVW
ncbi:GntR family transcriptional regulator [Streptomyces sp. GC420]|nr:GntR family transcriptional regulator [Streptomyces sp. GC420]